jgi:hypothetical protein
MPVMHGPATALNLLSLDTEACGLVQTEMNSLELKHGQANPLLLGAQGRWCI